ncbi:DUF4148 domain-containing protein [Burkholderia sp. Ac-20365]|uniref:DUF4148 domain-containing protein n=1 Tax=Burkholderia sp. Ac-20365 TaxID=2703897 RepID=UPI00197C0EB3|nr:DUF4148 domain-containing protein [Burkholderia sp. Ac-20365]MBN3762231.1 DUF4148 domain-containing protein [Burkholderia sp. Ac-20365]
MKSFIVTIAAASALALPVASFSQTTDTGTTRAQVRAELQQLEQAGYDPGKGENPTYPADVQAAEARASATSATGYGGTASGSTSFGSRATTHPASAEEMHQIYFGGQ